MKCVRADTKIEAEHGIIASFPEDFFGYFGWPTVCRMENGTLVVAASGFRNAHICPFGRTIICTSADEGSTWTSPSVVNDFPIDDRDSGICSPGPGVLVISWFSSDTRISLGREEIDSWQDSRSRELYRAGFARITERSARERAGNWIRVTRDGGDSWGPPVRVPITSPHGPTVLADSRLFYLGKGYLDELGNTTQLEAGIGAMVSEDQGSTWHPLGTVPLADGTDGTNYYEPHVVELAKDNFLGLVRIQDGTVKGRLKKIGIEPFSMVQTRSVDGGLTWSKAQPLNFHGAPPHLLRHSSGTLVCVYGYRLEPYGERVMLSYDEGETWEYGRILRDDGPDRDLGYPSSVELSDGSIFTVYYQKIGSSEEKPSLLWSRWRVPSSLFGKNNS